MLNKTLALSLDFSILRKLNDNSGVNTTITSKYFLITVNGIKFPELLEEIQKDFNLLINKYISKYPFIIE